jgi:hypothetical protein
MCASEGALLMDFGTPISIFLLSVARAWLKKSTASHLGLSPLETLHILSEGTNFATHNNICQ